MTIPVIDPNDYFSDNSLHIRCNYLFSNVISWMMYSEVHVCTLFKRSIISN